MPKPNAVEYAEQTLGVHKVHDDALARYHKYEDAVDAGVDARAKIRVRKEALEDRERVLVSDQASVRQELTDAKWKEHMKGVLAADEQYQHLLDELHEAEFTRDRADADARIHEHGVRVHTARMEELAGLLNFYAAAKKSQ